jgi:cyclin-dependent kinase 15
MQKHLKKNPTHRIVKKRDVVNKIPIRKLGRPKKEDTVKFNRFDLSVGVRIGHGAFSVIHEAIFIEKKEKIALKIYKNENDWLEEVGIIKKVDCYDGTNGCIRYIPELFDKENLFIGMELMPDNLQAFIDRQLGPIPVKTIQAFMRGILSGLATIHDKNVIHRDLKPNNVLINGEIAKLADFGYAKEIGLGQSSIKGVYLSYYRPPEVYIMNKAGRGYGINADLWAAGCIFVEMFKRKELFTNGGLPLLDIMKNWIIPTAKEINVMCKNHSKGKEDCLDAKNMAEKSKALPLSSHFADYKADVALYAEDLALSLLRWVPTERISAKMALKKQFFTEEFGCGKEMAGRLHFDGWRPSVQKL